MRIKMLLMAVVLAGLLFSLSASAQTPCTCDDPITTDAVCDQVPAAGGLGTDINSVLYIPKFDSELGCLQSVRVTAESCGYVWAEVDSESLIPDGITWDVTAVSGVRVSLPGGLGSKLVQFGTVDGPEPLFTAPDDPTELPLGSIYNPDFMGPDYARIDFGSLEAPICSEVTEFNFNTEADKQLFIGSAGEVLPVTVVTSGQAGAVGPNTNVGFHSFAQANAKVCVEYTYCLAPPKLCINGSKVNDCTDEGLAGWTINLQDATGAQIATTTTDANGEYSFCGLLPGSYTVCEVMKPNWKNVGPTCIPVALIEDNAEGQDFRNTPPFCISGHKFNNATDAGLIGWTINLKDATGAVKATTTTGADGSYKFCGLSSGSYTVCEVMKAGWKNVGDICKPVTLNCGDETDVDFRNDQVKTGCDTGCPWHIVSELYKASCGVPLEVSADHGILANDRVGAEVINPGSITIDPKYGTLSVDGDGSFTYTPAQKIASGTYVTFKYGATDGICAATGQGTAKIQVYCKR